MSKNRPGSDQPFDAEPPRSLLRNGTQSRSPLEAWLFVTPGDVMHSIRRRLPSVIFTTVVVALLVTGLLLVWPNHYSSEGLMYVRLGRGALAVDPTTKTSQAVSLQESRTAEVISIGEMIGSREIAERVVDRVGVDEVNRPRTWVERFAERVDSYLTSTSSAVGSLRGSTQRVGDWSPERVAAQLDRERAVRDVLEALDIEVVKDGYTVTIAAKEHDPLLAQAIVQSVMDEYGRYHVEAHRSEGSEAFFEAQAKASRLTAMQAREELQSTQNEMGWLSAESAETALRERIIDLESNLNSVESRLAEADSQAEELERRLAETPKWVPTEVTTGIANAAGDQLRSQLYDVQVEDGEELAKISPNHPRYQRLSQKMNESQSLAEAERSERTERTEAINPVHIELQTQRQTVGAKAVGLKSRRDALQSRLDATTEDLQRLNRDRTTLARLTWEAELSEEIYRDHARSLEEARINAKLDEQQMSDVSIVQPATLNLKKSGPARGILSLVGVLLGLSLGFLQAILRDPPLAQPLRRGNSHPLGTDGYGPAQQNRTRGKSESARNGRGEPVEKDEEKTDRDETEAVVGAVGPVASATSSGVDDLTPPHRNLPR